MVELRKIENPFVVVVSHDFAQSRERVFDAWLDPVNVGNWLFATPDGQDKICQVDPREGGNFIIGEKRGDDYAKHVGTYHQIDRPELIIFSYYYETEEEDLASNVIVKFEESEKGCLVTVTHEMDDIFAEYEASAIEGWTMIFEGLVSYI